MKPLRGFSILLNQHTSQHARLMPSQPTVARFLSDTTIVLQYAAIHTCFVNNLPIQFVKASDRDVVDKLSIQDICVGIIMVKLL